MEEAPSPLRVFLVDDHPTARAGIRALLDAGAGVEVVGEADGVTRTLEAVITARPDVALVDVRLRDGNGIELCRAIRSAAPDVACVLLTSHSDDEALVEATLAGAAGYALKQVRIRDLVDLVRLAAAGGELIRPEIRARVVAHLAAETPDLDDAEVELLRMIGAGMADAEIASAHELPPYWVVGHVRELLGRLGIDRRLAPSVPA